jgi:hypothetical protein
LLGSALEFEFIDIFLEPTFGELMMFRNCKNLRSAIGICAALLTTTFAHAAVDNPLDPLYYSQRVRVSVADTPLAAIGNLYSESTNPLHPSFSRIGARNWEGTAFATSTFYLNHANPLHPTYKKQ